jgi:hypothetical protein
LRGLNESSSAVAYLRRHMCIARSTALISTRHQPADMADGASMFVADPHTATNQSPSAAHHCGDHQPHTTAATSGQKLVQLAT